MNSWSIRFIIITFILVGINAYRRHRQYSTKASSYPGRTAIWAESSGPQSPKTPVQPSAPSWTRASGYEVISCLKTIGQSNPCERPSDYSVHHLQHSLDIKEMRILDFRSNKNGCDHLSADVVNLLLIQLEMMGKRQSLVRQRSQSHKRKKQILFQSFFCHWMSLFCIVIHSFITCVEVVDKEVWKGLRPSHSSHILSLLRCEGLQGTAD